MKQKLLYIILLFFTLAWSDNLWALGENTSYVLNNGGEYSIGTIGTGPTFTLSGPGVTLTFEGCRTIASANYFYLETSEDGSNWNTQVKEFDLKTNSVNWKLQETKNWTSYSYNLNNNNIRYIRFKTYTGATLTKYYRNIKITRATTLSLSSSSPALTFGDIHRGKNKTIKPKVDYNNTMYNQQITGSGPDGCYSVTSQTVGETGSGLEVPVKFTAGSSATLGAHNGNVTLSMNGKTVTIAATANVVTTYYGQAKAQASVGGSAAVSFTSYAAATTTSDDANTANTSAAKGSNTAYYKATVTNGYRFLGWIKGTDNYSAGNVVSTNLEYNPTIEYTSENSSSPTVTTYKAWFAPMFYFSATAVSSNETSGTATANVTTEIQGNIGETSKSATATFTATPKENCTFEGWYSSDTYSGTSVSTSTTYTYTLSNNTIGSTTSKTFYALFKKNQNLQWEDASLDLNLVLGNDYSSAATRTSDKTITYTSSNTEAVTVDDDGTVHAVGLGQSIVTASVEGDFTYNAESISREFSVGEKLQASFAPEWGEGTSTDIKVGTSTTIALTNIATDNTFTISATPTGIISWSRSGNTLTINGDVAGTTTLTLAQAGSKFLSGTTANYTITVSKYANTFALAAEDKAMEVGEVWQNVVTNTGNKNTQVSYSVSGVAVYDAINNRIIAESEGSTAITFTQAATATHDAVSKTVNVIVSKVANTLSLTLPTQEVDVDGTITLTISGKNSNAELKAEITDAELSSAVNNGTDVISYANGIITAKNAGTAKIKFTQAANDMYTGYESAVYNITVNKISNSISVKLNGELKNSMNVGRGAQIALDYTSSASSDGEFHVRLSSGSNATGTISGNTITAGSTDGTNIWTISQDETYKYEAASASVRVKVNSVAEAVGYVLEDPNGGDWGTINSYTCPNPLSGPGDVLSFDAYRTTAGANYFYVMYSTDGGSSYQELANPSLTTSYKNYSYQLPDGVTNIKFETRTGATLHKYVNNIYVTRKTYVKATASNTALGEMFTDKTASSSFTVDYSTTNGGNIEVISNNPRFTVNKSSITVEENSDNVGAPVTVNVTYTPDPDHLGADEGIITISDRYYTQELTFTATAKKYGTTILRGSNTETATTVGGTIENVFAFTGTSTAAPSSNSSDDFYYTISHTQTSAVNNGEGVISYNPQTNTIKGLNAGTARLTIYQKKTNLYNATSQTFDFTVTKLANNVSLALSATTLNVDGTATVVVTNDDSNGVVTATFSNILYANETQNRDGGLLSYTATTKAITGVNAGTGTVTVTQAETYKYEAKSATFNVTVNKLSQTLTWDNPDLETTMQKGTTHEGNTATSSVGLTPVTYASSNTAAITVDANTGVLTAVDVGSNVTITASQAGNYKYLPAALTRMFSVYNKQTPAYSTDEHFTGLNCRIEIEGTATITVTGVSDDDDFSITIGDNSVINVERSGETITIIGLTLGSTTLTLTQEGNDDFIAKSVTYNIEVYMPDDYLTLAPSEAPSFTAGTYRRVVLNRSLKAGYNSLALPFNTTVEELVGADYDVSTDWVAQLSLVTYNKKDGYSLYFEKKTEIEANQPYILHLGANKASVVFKNVVLVNAASVIQTATGGVNGYANWQMVSNYATSFDMEGKYGVVNASYCLKKGAAGSTLKAYTAYIVYNGSASAEVKAAYLDEDEADGLLEVLKGEPLSEEDVYDLQGRKLSRSQRGLNIIRGDDGVVRKVICK
jgi:hypothetical protein